MAFDGTDFPPKDDSGGGEPLPERPATKWRPEITTYLTTPFFAYAMRHEHEDKNEDDTWYLVFITKEPFPGAYAMTINKIDKQGNYWPIFHDDVMYRDDRFHGYATDDRDPPASLSELLAVTLRGLGYNLSAGAPSWLMSEKPLVSDDVENICVDGRVWGNHQWFVLH